MATNVAIRRIDIDQLLPAIERNALILTPNHRIQDAILTSYSNNAESSVFRTPRVFAIDIWVRELWELAAHSGISPCCEAQLISPTQERFIWTNVIESSLSDIPLLNPDDTAQTVNQSYRDLRQWIMDAPLTRLRPFNATPDVAAFMRWIGSYQAFCAEYQLVSLVDAIALLSEPEFLDAVKNAFLPSEICLVNFFDSPPLYKKFFEGLGTASKVRELNLVSAKSATTAYRYSFVDQNSELIACASWARQLAQEKPNCHIGIIACEDLLAQPETRHTINTALDRSTLNGVGPSDSLYNSTGSRLSLMDSAMVHDAFLLLNLNNEQQQATDLCRLLQSPFLSGAESEVEQRLQMEIMMRRYFTANVSMTDFCWHLSQTDRDTHCPQLASAIINSRTRHRQYPHLASARKWVQCINTLLEDFAWPNQHCSSGELEIQQLWQRALRELSDSSALLGNLGFNNVVTRLKSLCQQQAQSSHFRADNPLSIYTVTEAIGLQFDHVWLLGFSDQSWPPAAKPSPFIPYSLQLEAGIPGSHSDLQFQRSKQLFGILQHSVSDDFIASFHHSDGELTLTASSFIQPLDEREHPTPVAVASDYLLSHQPAIAAMQYIEDLPNFALQTGETVRGGQSIISNQSSCPFRAFAKHRLKAEPLAKFETGLSHAARGSAIHSGLEQLFSDIQSRQALLDLSADERSTLIDKAAQQAIDWLSKHYRELMTPRFRALEKQRIATLLQRFLELESSREPFTVVAREAAYQQDFDGLTLRLKIDRIDQLDNGSLALIDYKTGKHATKSKSWTDPRPEDMQLPLYYSVASSQQGETVSALAIAHLNVDRIAYSGVAARQDFHESMTVVEQETENTNDWNELADEWQHKVATLAQEFVAGLATVTPINRPGTCQYCGLDALCRIQEIDTAPVDEETESASESGGAS